MNKELIINTYEEEILLFKENLLGTFKDNILTYENETDSFKIDINDHSLEKENLESILNIKKEKAILTLKELNHRLEIPIQKHNFQNKDNKITIEYRLESQEKALKIEIEMSDLS